MSPTPDLMPVLSAGKHRTPRKGACFMEMASYLAGEKWSDHPACTHPLLASVAREVNDHLGDTARRRIAPLIPDVVGLTSDDPRSTPWIAREVALAALPVVSAERQRVLAVGLFTCERLLAAYDARPTDDLTPRARAALDADPPARDWARRTVRIGTGDLRGFVRRGGPTIVHTAVVGLAEAAIPDPDDRLVALLERLLVLCHTWFDTDTSARPARESVNR